MSIELVVASVAILLSLLFFVRAIVEPIRARAAARTPEAIALREADLRATGFDGPTSTWDAGEMISLGAERFTANAGVLVAAYLVATLVTVGLFFGTCWLIARQWPGPSTAGMSPGMMMLNGGLGAPSATSGGASFDDLTGGTGSVGGMSAAMALRVRLAGGGIAALVSTSFFGVGLGRMCLAAARGESPRFATVFGGARKMFAYRGTLVLYALATLLGTALLIVPGWVVLLTLPLAPFYVIDEDAGPIQALRSSWRATKGNAVQLFVLILFANVAAFLGFVFFGLGIVVALPIAGIAFAGAYVRMSGKGVTAPVTLGATPPRFIFAGAAGLLFAGSVYVTSLQHAHAHAKYTVLETVIQVIAVISGVLFMLSLLTAALPFLLDRLEARNFSSFVAARHVRSQKSGFLTIISILSICGVAVSSCALSSVVSVMGGFRADLKRKILGNNAHIVVDTVSQSTWADEEPVLARVRAIPGVMAATPVVHGEVMVWSASNLAGVVVRGIDPATINNVVDLGKNIEVGKFDYLVDPAKLSTIGADEVIGIGPGGEMYTRGKDLSVDDVDPKENPNHLPGPNDIDPLIKLLPRPEPVKPGVIIGRELAKTLHVYVGDDVTLVSPLGDLGPMGVMPRTKKFKVAAIFYSGMYEYDATQVYTLMDVAQDFFGLGDKISAIDVKVDDAERADRLTETVQKALDRPELRTRDWREMNKNLFSALQLEHYAAFIVLSIQILVASFCIICTLLLMVTEKGKEIAILKAIGATDGSIRRTFTTEGLVIGAIGTIFGMATALALCTGLAWFGLRLDPDVYYIDQLPISVNGWDFFAVGIAALSICTLSTVYPARAASRLRPVDGLRYE